MLLNALGNDKFENMSQQQFKNTSFSKSSSSSNTNKNGDETFVYLSIEKQLYDLLEENPELHFEATNETFSHYDGNNDVNRDGSQSTSSNSNTREKLASKFNSNIKTSSVHQTSTSPLDNEDIHFRPQSSFSGREISTKRSPEIISGPYKEPIRFIKRFSSSFNSKRWHYKKLTLSNEDNWRLRIPQTTSDICKAEFPSSSSSKKDDIKDMIDSPNESNPQPVSSNSNIDNGFNEMSMNVKISSNEMSTIVETVTNRILEWIQSSSNNTDTVKVTSKPDSFSLCETGSTTFVSAPYAESARTDYNLPPLTSSIFWPPLFPNLSDAFTSTFNISSLRSDSNKWNKSESRSEHSKNLDIFAEMTRWHFTENITKLDELEEYVQFMKPNLHGLGKKIPLIIDPTKIFHRKHTRYAKKCSFFEKANLSQVLLDWWHLLPDNDKIPYVKLSLKVFNTFCDLCSKWPNNNSSSEFGDLKKCENLIKKMIDYKKYFNLLPVLDEQKQKLVKLRVSQNDIHHFENKGLDFVLANLPENGIQRKCIEKIMTFLCKTKLYPSRKYTIN